MQNKQNLIGNHRSAAIHTHKSLFSQVKNYNNGGMHLICAEELLMLGFYLKRKKKLWNGSQHLFIGVNSKSSISLPSDFFLLWFTLSPHLLYCSSATRNRNVYMANSGVAVFIALLLPAVGPISYPRIRCKKVSNGANGCRLHRTFRSQCCRCRST